MQIEDMKQLVKDADTIRRQELERGPTNRALYALILVVSELVAREDERVRLGK